MAPALRCPVCQEPTSSRCGRCGGPLCVARYCLAVHTCPAKQGA